MIYHRLKNRRGQVRSGSLLLEAIAGLAAIGIALVLISRTTIAVDRQWQLTAQERLASETLDNALEVASSIDWEEVTTDRLAELSLSDHAQKSLHQVALSADVSEETTPVPAKRLHLTLTWQPMPDATPLKRSLTVWIYPSAISPAAISPAVFDPSVEEQP